MGGSVNKIKDFVFEFFNFLGKLLAFLLGLLFVPMVIIFGALIIITQIITFAKLAELFTGIDGITSSLLNLAYNGNFVPGFIIYFLVSLILMMTFTWKIKKTLFVHGVPLAITGLFFAIINSFYSIFANNLPGPAVEYLENNMKKILDVFWKTGVLYLISGVLLIGIAVSINFKTKKKKKEEQEESGYVKSLTLESVEYVPEEELSDVDKTNKLFTSSEEELLENNNAVIVEEKEIIKDIPIEINNTNDVENFVIEENPEPLINVVEETSFQEEEVIAPLPLDNQDSIIIEPQLQENSVQTAYCTSCGHPYEQDSVFCINCGQKR